MNFTQIELLFAESENKFNARLIGDSFQKQNKTVAFFRTLFVNLLEENISFVNQDLNFWFLQQFFALMIA